MNANPNLLEWSVLAPMLISALGVVVWSMLRGAYRAIEALRKDLDGYARREDLRQAKDDLQRELNEAIFRFDRHEEASTARWVNHPNVR
jgi:type II secretory pathway component PulJ